MTRIKRRTLLKAVGVFVACFTLVANLQYAIFGYGFDSLDNGGKLMAQTATATSNRTICGKDTCSKTWTYGVPPFQVTVKADGHYWHCQNNTENSYCTSSACAADCDAVEPSDPPA